jgi:hypothetical protein
MAVLRIGTWSKRASSTEPAHRQLVHVQAACSMTAKPPLLVCPSSARCPILFGGARRFRSLGGVVLEDTAFSRLDVYDDAALLTLNTAQQQQQTRGTSQAAATSDSSGAGGAGGRGAAFETAPVTAAAAGGGAGRSVVSAGLVLDALGGFSPLSAQARGGQQPEAAMLLVGSCVEGAQQHSGSSSSSSADVLWGWTPLDRWEASCTRPGLAAKQFG